MKVICAWCFASMGEAEPLTDQSLIKRICPQCFQVLLAKCRLPEIREHVVDDPHDSPNAPHMTASGSAPDDVPT